MSTTYPLADFQPGDRVQLHSATDAWARGDRYGTVESIGRKWLYVRMDRSSALRRVAPADVAEQGRGV